jgi:hypothetical protein
MIPTNKGDRAMDQPDYAKLLCDKGWEDSKFRWCSGASAIGAEQTFAPLRGCHKKIAVALLVDCERDLISALAAWPGGKPNKVLACYEHMVHIIGKERTDTLLIASNTTCKNQLIIFKGKEIPFHDSWNETFIVPFMRGHTPGPHFVRWATTHKLIVVMAKCGRGTLGGDVSIFFNSFSADAEHIFPHFTLSTKECYTLMNDLFCILGEDNSGEWGASIPPAVHPPPPPHSLASFSLSPPTPKKKTSLPSTPKSENPFLRLSKIATISSNKRQYDHTTTQK